MKDLKLAAAAVLIVGPQKRRYSNSTSDHALIRPFLPSVSAGLPIPQSSPIQSFDLKSRAFRSRFCILFHFRSVLASSVLHSLLSPISAMKTHSPFIASSLLLLSTAGIVAASPTITASPTPTVAPRADASTVTANNGGSGIAIDDKIC